MIMPIRKYGDEVLRRKAEPVAAFDKSLSKLAEDMAETMYAAPGVGLAAPQVGVGKRLIVVDVSTEEAGKDLHVFVNPVIVDHSPETERREEGCLSVPEFFEAVVRPARIRVSACDVTEKPFELEADGMLARCIQHEIDHLDGVLFVDHITGFRGKLLKGKLKRSFGVGSPAPARS